ncbi:MAG: NAD(P)H-dependent oxidoreductase [Methylocystaceae bacterium]|nr:NAD(P)H-dependent oxidoreductase [Methylocystaceae bacterium]
MNVFLLNGAEPRGYSKGFYNGEMTRVAEAFFTELGDDVEKTIIADGYDVQEEVAKLKKADVIIFQFPIYWFHMPGMMKTYIDDVFMTGRGEIWINDGRDQGGPYGSGGLMQEKRYMLSTTWNAPLEAFNDKSQVFAGADVDGALFPFHRMMAFMGAKPLASFACHNIVKAGDVEKDKELFVKHLEQVFVFHMGKVSK